MLTAMDSRNCFTTGSAARGSSFSAPARRKSLNTFAITARCGRVLKITLAKVALLLGLSLWTPTFAASPVFPAFPAIIVRTNLPPRNFRLAWTNTEPSAVDFQVYFWTNGGGTNLFDAGNTNTVVLTNLARRARWNFYVTAFDSDGDESSPSITVTWPPPPPTNRVVTVFTLWRESDALAGPWSTNRVQIFSETNPPNDSHFWQSLDLSITVTNF